MLTTEVNSVLVSVIMITYNHSKYIRQAINGVTMQKTNFKFELIVGDDLSTDGTQDIIRELAQKKPDIIKPILRDKNMGAVLNFNDLLSRSKGKYIAICDGDDFWTSEYKLQKQVDFLESNTEYMICCHPVLQVYDDKSQSDVVLHPLKLAGKDAMQRGELTIHDLIRMNTIASLSTMYRWEIERKLPEWLNGYSVVDYVLLSLHADLGPIGVVDEVMGTYRKHSGGTWWNHTQYDTQKRFMSLLQDIDKELGLKYHDEYMVIIKYIEKELKNYEETDKLSDGKKNIYYDLINRVKKISHLFRR